MQKITPCLWFDDQAEEAAKFYVSVFKNSRINTITYYPKVTEQVSGKKEGTVLTVVFELNGQEFVALNGGSNFKITPAISFVVNCESQEEIDFMWDKLSSGGDESAQQCGWLADKYGISWQIVPAAIEEWLKDPARAERIMAKLLDMKKLDFAVLEAAAS